MPTSVLFCTPGFNSLLQLTTEFSTKSKSYCDWRSGSQSVLVSNPHLGITTRYLLLFDSYSLVIVGRPLWQEGIFYRAEQSKAVAYCRQPASTATLGIEPRWDPWPIYLFSVKTFVVFSFVVPPLIKREGLDFFIIGVSLLHLIPPEVTLK
jgi:hypothetical protein